MDKAAELLKALADKLGVTVDYLWPKLVGHEAVQAWVGVIGGGVGFLVLLVLSIFVVRWAFKTADGDSPAPSVISVLLIAACVTCLVGSLASIADVVYPEAAALKTIAGGFK